MLHYKASLDPEMTPTPAELTPAELTPAELTPAELTPPGGILGPELTPSGLIVGPDAPTGIARADLDQRWSVRSTIRLDSPAAVTIVSPHSAPAGPGISATTRSISEGAMLLLTEADLKTNVMIDLLIVLPRVGPRIDASYEVRGRVDRRAKHGYRIEVLERDEAFETHIRALRETVGQRRETTPISPGRQRTPRGTKGQPPVGPSSERPAGSPERKTTGSPQRNTIRLADVADVRFKISDGATAGELIDATTRDIGEHAMLLLTDADLSTDLQIEAVVVLPKIGRRSIAAYEVRARVVGPCSHGFHVEFLERGCGFEDRIRALRENAERLSRLEEQTADETQ